MNTPPYTIFSRHDRYVTSADAHVGAIARTLPSLAFYARMAWITLMSSHAAKRERYGDDEWCASSEGMLRGLERSGCRFEISGMRHLGEFEGPAVFVSNHMSTLETFVLPVLIQPVKPVTFVIKPSLMEYPVFRHVMRSRNPIVVSRDNPRQDLVTVLEEGKHRLEAGRSVILFPQTTRSAAFDAAQFNSLGVKLARSAGVPVVPVALQTSAWSNGRRFKDYGPILPRIPVHIRFGAPIQVEGNGRAEHDQIVQFIERCLAEWTTSATIPAG